MNTREAWLLPLNSADIAYILEPVQTVSSSRSLAFRRQTSGGASTINLYF
jgi:hypothetical protein